jgi:4,4'-diaponeurosporenoate glycosyltransferase
VTIALVVAGWVCGWVLLVRLPRVPRAAADPSALDDLAVVVPARDEAHNLPGLLQSLGDVSEVVVVDDGSTDATAEVAAVNGARVVTAPPLPRGWAGKPWACHTGVGATHGSRLLFLDADVRLAPGALGRLAAARPGGGLLSVQPYHQVERPWEQLSAVPNLVALMASGIGALLPSPRPGLAFGPCLLTDRADLDAVGGFVSVADEVLEDAALARRYEVAGRPVVCLVGGRDVRFRMFPTGLRSLVDGWSRTLSGGARRARLLPLLGSVLWVTGALLAPFAGLVAYAAFAIEAFWALRRVGSFRWWVALTFPLFVVAFVALFARSVVLRRVRWRGRELEARP